MLNTQPKRNLLNLIAAALLVVIIFGGEETLAQFTFMGDYDKTFAAPNGYYVDALDIDPLIPSANAEQSYLYTGEVLNNGSLLAAGAIYYRTFGNGDGQDFYIRKFTASGAIDTSFGGGAGFVRADFFRRYPASQPWEQNAGGSLDSPDVLKVQPDGKILFAGSCQITSPENIPNFGRDICLIRYNADGSIDTSFGNSMVFTGNSNGQIYPFQVGAGRVMFQTGLQENGNRSGTNGWIHDMKIQPDGKIILVGETTDYIAPFVQGAATSRSVGIIIRLNPDGSLDTDFGAGGIAKFIGVNTATNPNDFGCWTQRRFYAVALQPDGRIIAAGHDGVNNASCFQGTVFVITRWTANGQLETVRRLDNSTDISAREKAVSAHLAPGNKVVVSGSYQGKAAMVRLNLSDLSLDATFGTNGIQGYLSGNRTLNIRAVQPDGKIIGVDDAFINGNGVVRFNPNGSSDQSFGNASWNGAGGQSGRLSVIQTLSNGATGTGGVGDILVRPNGRINLLGSIGGNCPPQLCRGWVSRQNTVFRNGIYADFENDGRDNLAVYRPSEGVWHNLDSRNNQYSAVQWGVSTDKIAPADYDGDGRTDRAVYRDGTWYIHQSADAGVRIVNFGLAGDLPRPGDFDGDGLADIAVWRPSNGTWYWLNSSTGAFGAVQFGLSGDAPMLGDYDADGKTDFTVFRPSNGVWYTFRSSDNQVLQNPFGLSGDIPLNGDFNGDSKADLAVFRPSDRTWYIARPTGVPAQTFEAIPFGLSTDTPVPADYDNDGQADVAVYRNGVWWIRKSGTGGVAAVQFGLSSDKPLAAAYLP